MKIHKKKKGSKLGDHAAQGWPWQGEMWIKYERRWVVNYFLVRDFC